MNKKMKKSMIGVESILAPHPPAVIGASLATITVIIEISNRQAFLTYLGHMLIKQIRTS
jgi:hypothetical protein